MSTVLIKKSMLDNLEYNSGEMSAATKTSLSASDKSSPTIEIIFKDADLHAAIHSLIKSLQSPFAANAIASVLIQESVKSEFIGKLQVALKAAVSAGAVLENEANKQALEMIKTLNAQTINAGASVLVFDFSHEQLAGVGTNCGVVTVGVFRTVKEAIALAGKQSSSNVSIWNSNHAAAYEVAAALSASNFFINCDQNAPMEAFKQHAAGGFATIENNYHYEVLSVKGVEKKVVFPLGTVFAN